MSPTSLPRRAHPGLRVLAVALATLMAAPALGADAAAQGGARREARAALAARLDSIIRAELAQAPLAGVSVAVLHGRDTVFERGYGSAELGLGAPATEATTYRVIGPLLAVALMQQVERGRLRLEDDASRWVPEFPWQGRRVTVRQLMDATSGLPDYHYLGDAQRGLRAVPKAQDEVVALFAGRPFLHEPGERWQWTISGFVLAGMILERVTGQQYAGYLQEHVFRRAGLTRSFYCDDLSVVPGLARSYETYDRGFQHIVPESPSLYPFTITACMTATDAATLMRALRDGRLLRPETYATMTTAEGAARQTDVPQTSRGVGIRIAEEDGHRWVGERGNLMGFSTALMDFPQDSLTVAVVTNTLRAGGGGGPTRIARSLARAVLGLPPLPPGTGARPSEPLPANGASLTAAERARYLGSYRLRYAGDSPPMLNFERTYRVFEENGRLMVQGTGVPAEPLLHHHEHSFRMASWPTATLTFTVAEGRVVALTAADGPSVMRGPRTGEPRPLTPRMN